MDDELTCLNKHTLFQVNNGYGTKGKKTKCSNCGKSSKNNFVSCIECKYDLCIKCQENTLSSRQKSSKPEVECLHEKDNFTHCTEVLEDGACSNVTCERGSKGFFVCNCGLIYCKYCYLELYPEDRDKYTESLHEDPENETRETGGKEEITEIKVDNNVDTKEVIPENKENKESKVVKMDGIKLTFKDESNQNDETRETNEAKEITETDFEKPTEIKESNAEITQQDVTQTEVTQTGQSNQTPQTEKNITGQVDGVDETTHGQKSGHNNSLEIKEEFDIDTRQLNDKDPTKCKKWHDLVHILSPDHKRVCSKCASKDLEEYYFCEECDYVHCAHCYKGEVIQSKCCCIIM